MSKHTTEEEGIDMSQDFINFCKKLGLNPTDELWENYLWAEKVVQDK